MENERPSQYFLACSYNFTKHEEYNRSIKSLFGILTNIMESHCFSKIFVYQRSQIKFNTKFLSISRANLLLSNKKWRGGRWPESSPTLSLITQKNESY